MTVNEDRAPAPRVPGDRPLGLIERLRQLRNTVVAHPRFQKWAAGFPLTRPAANARALALFNLCAGFVYSQVLKACVELKVLDAVAERPVPLDALATACGLPEDRARHLFDAAAALKLLDRIDASARLGAGDAAQRTPSYALGELGAALRGNAGALAMIHHHALLYDDLRDPVALLRDPETKTRLADYWGYAGASVPADLAGDATAPYSTLMGQSQHLVAGDLLDAYRVVRHGHILDVGGGDGTFLRAVAERAPDTIGLTLFDLPSVATNARAQCAAAGLGSRIACVGGSFLDDPLPRGADLITLVRVLFDHDDATVAQILTACADALAPGGTLLVAEQMGGPAGGAEVGDAYFGFYLLAMGRGRPRRPKELSDMLKTAGFSRVRTVRTRRPMLVQALVATRG